MKILRSFTAIACLQVLLFGLSAKAEPVKIIFDTDITGDVDDVLALAMLHTLADRGHCELLGVTVSKSHPLTGPFVDAVNTMYGRPDLPIGIAPHAPPRDSRYLSLVEEKTPAGEWLYPHDLRSNTDTPTALQLFRRILAAQPDHSVVIVQVGLGFNVAELLESPPDAESSLDGKSLVRQKVRLLSIMAGRFQHKNPKNRFLEANVRNHLPSMKTVAADWPQEVPAIWSGFEIGIAVPYPRESVHHDFSYQKPHLVKEAYLAHSGPEHDRPTWDLTSVLYAVWPKRGYFDLSQPGQVIVEKDGYTRFEPSAEGRDRYLKMRPEQVERVREALVQLVSQPPQS
ncbi:Inosine-uridine preferring nucleoside hydrolase [Planctomycetales bacterium 10988]|nr:Inosine-uridine preferring nucleoside hydrolase [Planctomycetales bacterium 10988]